MRKIMGVLIIIIVILGGYSYFVNRKVSLAKERVEKERIAQIAAEKLEQEQTKQAEVIKQVREKKVIEEYKSVALSSLKDPSSAVFRNIKIAESPRTIESAAITYEICGEVNAKNGFGGYVGFRGFVVTSSGLTAPTTYMQEDKLVGIYYEIVAKRIGCI